jgi:hypothetical protein
MSYGAEKPCPSFHTNQNKSHPSLPATPSLSSPALACPHSLHHSSLNPSLLTIGEGDKRPCFAFPSVYTTCCVRSMPLGVSFFLYFIVFGAMALLSLHLPSVSIGQGLSPSSSGRTTTDHTGHDGLKRRWTPLISG